MTGCASFKKKVNRENLDGQYITSKTGEYQFIPPKPIVKEFPSYSWNKKDMGGFWRITKDFFRCKGSPMNPMISKENDKSLIRDCVGGENHGLPVRDGKEFIYTCLIELLNHIQEKTKKKVVITTGYRCPQHNHYADQSSLNKTSKHMMGAEVDFYVEGMEKEPEKIVSLLQMYYKKHHTLSEDKEYVNFQRMDAAKYNVTIPPWANKEIFIKLNLETENRDFDNSHPYPYITLQVRYDRENDKKVVFDEKQTNQYLRK